MFVSFEGIDGSGKSTQLELLVSRMRESGYQVEVFREPGGCLLYTSGTITIVEVHVASGFFDPR